MPVRLHKCIFKIPASRTEMLPEKIPLVSWELVNRKETIAMAFEPRGFGHAPLPPSPKGPETAFCGNALHAPDQNPNAAGHTKHVTKAETLFRTDPIVMRHVTHYLHGAQPGIERVTCPPKPWRRGKRGPKPISEQPMTHAERQARYRAAHAEGAPPKIKYRKPADRRSRPQRWRDAVTELVEMQAGYQVWLDALPEILADGAMAEALRAICDYDFSELENLEPPRGFGRD
jgi:hypothetical protein